MKRFYIFSITILLLSSGKMVAQQNPDIQFPFDKAYDFYLNQDESLLIVPEGNEITIISMEERKIVNKIQTQHQSNITAIAVSSDEKFILTGDMEGEIHLYSEEGSLIKNFEIHSSTIYALEFHPTEAKFISCSKDGKLLVTKYLTDSEPIILHTSRKPVYSASFSKDGSLIVAGFNNGWLRIYDGRTHAEMHSKKLFSNAIRTLAIFPNKRVYAGGDNSVLKIWDYEKDVVKSVKTQNISKDWILSFNSDEKNSFLSFGNYSGYIHTKILDLIYVINYRNPVLKVKTIQHPNFSIETVALIKDLGIVFIPVDKMTLPKEEAMHKPKRYY